MNPPHNNDSLEGFLNTYLDLAPPPAPLEYLSSSFFPTPTSSPDSVVWANRGGGKTFYAAVATLLDLLFKPGIEIKILAGSLEQAQRMHEHLRTFLLSEPFAHLLDGNITERRARLINASRVDLLAQSHTSVRGSRPQVLRCDEVDLFDPDIWQAAQLAPRSRTINTIFMPGRVEALSTWHRPGGLMEKLINETKGPNPRRTLHKWGVVDVLETCPPNRPCNTCPLDPDCAGRAKHTRGHIAIDDAINLKQRVSLDTWESEMLCKRPRRSGAVFPEFNPTIHVRTFNPPAAARWVAGMDFGFTNPTVVLFACSDSDNTLWITDEYVQTQRTVSRHIQALLESRWPRPEIIGCDPAGHQVNHHTGERTIGLLKAAGFRTATSALKIIPGLDLVSARLKPAHGPPRLFVHQRCQTLIRSLASARLANDGKPVKDGTDHACDALRYLVTALDNPITVRCTTYRGAA